MDPQRKSAATAFANSNHFGLSIIKTDVYSEEIFVASQSEVQLTTGMGSFLIVNNVLNAPENEQRIKALIKKDSYSFANMSDFYRARAQTYLTRSDDTILYESCYDKVLAINPLTPNLALASQYVKQELISDDDDDSQFIIRRIRFRPGYMRI
jgi:hypothetical protein